MAETPPTAPMTPDERRAMFEAATPDTLVAVYADLREAREQVRKTEKGWTEKMEEVAAVLMSKMDQMKQESFRGQCGFTAYISELQTPAVLDHDDLRAFVASQEDGLDYLDLRPNKEMALSYAEAHDGALPPGVKLNSVRRLNVRKSN